MTRLLLAFLGLLAASTTTAASQVAEPAVQALLDSVVPAALRAERIPGAVVAVVSGGRVIALRGYGFADLPTQRPMTDSTIVRIGSVSKVMTAVAVAQLADRGAIDLRADVNRYLRDVRVPATYAAPVTPWHLLTHTAGLDEIRPGTQAGSRAEVNPLRQFLRDRLVRYAAPGEATAYSTYAITLAGLLVEDASGLPFERYLVERVWRPLGMTHTSIDVPARHRPLVARAYDVRDGAPVEAPWEWYHTTPASSVNSTARDMSRFMLAQLAGRSAALSERMTAEMLREQVTMHPELPGWGLGWQQLRRVNGDRGVQHGGDVAGFSSLVTLLPGRNVGVFVASHREGSDLRYAVTRAVLDLLAPAADSRGPVASMHPTASAAARRMLRFAGRYRANVVCHSCAAPMPVSEVTVTPNSDGSVSAFGGRFVEVSPLFFRSTDGQRRFGFRTDTAGNVTHLTVGSWQVLERVPPAIRDPSLHAEVQAVNDSMAAAFTAGDLRRVASFYTDDAIVEGPRGDRVEGRAAIDAYWARMSSPKSWTLEVLSVGGTRDQPYQIGRSTLVTGGATGDRVSIVEFLALWRRDGGGGLRMVVDYYRF